MSSYYEKFIATGEVKCIDEEIPFEIPSSWEWCRLLSIVSLLGDGIHGTPEYSEGGSVYFINGNNLFDGKILIKPDTKRVSKEEAVEHSRLLNESTVLVSINGTIGNIAFYSGENIILGKSACYFNLLNGIEKKYIMIVLQTDYFLEYAKRVATGSTIKNVPLSGMRNFLIPIPPEDEQQDIIDKLLSLKLLIEKFNVEQLQLDKLNAELRPVLRKSILQEAIQGKLVPQITEEGTAQDLLEQIRQEKWKLAKEGKIKKSALTDSVIYKGDDNKYYEQINNQIAQIECDYDFPSNWAIARLSSICTLVDGEKKDGQQICLDAKYLRGKSAGDYLQRGRFVQKGDNIILVDGENSGEVFTVPCDGYMGSTFKQLLVSPVTYLPYVLNFVLFYKELLRKSKRGAAIPHLNKEVFYSLIIGIPPYQEQVRIVNKINEIYSKIKG
ncbi:MAG: restriction endonuclease subunit S [Prevotella sp.]|nr:restriction endonuclease subunit S [Prevotella sp.]